MWVRVAPCQCVSSAGCQCESVGVAEWVRVRQCVSVGGPATRSLCLAGLPVCQCAPVWVPAGVEPVGVSAQLQIEESRRRVINPSND